MPDLLKHTAKIIINTTVNTTAAIKEVIKHRRRNKLVIVRKLESSEGRCI